MYQQRKKVVYSRLWNILVNNRIEMGSLLMKTTFHKEDIDTQLAFLAPSFFGLIFLQESFMIQHEPLKK